MKLTERKIETLEVERGRKDRLVFDDAQRGLAVRVTASGGRSYLCQYTLHGQKWRVPLGACSAVSLAKAREAAAAVMGDVAKGRNPVAERKEAAAAERAKRARDRLTVRALIDDWHRLHLAGRRPRYAQEAVRALHYAFADALDDAAEDLDRATVVRALDALARRRARQRGAADKPKGNAMTGRTAAYGRAAFVSGSARDLLRRMLPQNADDDRAAAERRASAALAFPGLLGSPFAGWSKAKAALDKSIVDARAKSAAEAGTTPPLLRPWSVHDLRRTVATGLQRLGIRLEVTEAVLNHVSGSRAGIAGVYQRHDWADEKRAALAGWAAHILAAVEGRTASPNVVTLVRAG